MKSFGPIEKRAFKRKGSDFESTLPTPASKQKLTRLASDRYLAKMSMHLFSSGFRWKVVEAKWPDIEEAFGGFEVMRVATLDEADIDTLATDTRVIRHRPKIVSIRDNARFIAEVEQGGTKFGKMISAWPGDDIIGLWMKLKKEGSRLGGNTGPYFLRNVGKDTFILTPDVVKCLVRAGVVDKQPTSKRDLAKVADAFNHWHQQTGRPLCQLSRIAACSID